MELYEKMGHELHELIVKKEVSAREVTDSFLSRIDAVEGKVKSFLTLLPDSARAQADEVDALVARGEQLPPLAGLPIAIKDNICTEGVLTTCASKMLYNFVPPYDATVITRMKQSHMPILGKTNLDEFAMGSSCENSAFQKTRNPYDLNRVPGGSSGGSAAAVAAAQAPFAVGSDTGGSIRQPACITGIVGLKPSYGAVSRYGLVAFGSSLDQIGPMTRCVRDNAMLFDLLAGPDEMDSTSARISRKPIAPDLRVDVKGLRIGLPREFFGEGIDPGVRACIMEAAQQYQRMGAQLVEVELPFAQYALPTYYIVSSAEASSNLARFDGVKYGYRSEHYDGLVDLYFKSRSEGFGPEVRRRIMLGTYVLASGYYDAYYKRAQLMRVKLKQVYDEAFERCDVLLTPASPTVAFRLGEKESDPLAMYLSDICTVSINMVELPALVLPCGTVEGLPMGMQLIGRKFSEELLYNVAYSFEQATGLGWTCPKL